MIGSKSNWLVLLLANVIIISGGQVIFALLSIKYCEKIQKISRILNILPY